MTQFHHHNIRVAVLLLCTLLAGAPAARASSPVAETVEVYGHSVRGRPLSAYVLGSGANVTVIFGAFHGNEATTAVVVEQLRAHLKAHPETIADARVILVPAMNPDGLAAGTRVNARGVDLNRNFPGSWRPRNARARYRPGPFAGSEPETQAVIALLRKYRPSKVISIHSPFHTMNWTGEPGRSLADLMRGYNHYPATNDIGYPTPGSFGYYCGRVLQVAIVTLELPAEPASSSWQANRDALLAAIQAPPVVAVNPEAAMQALQDQIRAGADAVYASSTSTP